MTSHTFFDHDQYARQFDEKEFWKQVKRTVDGKSVSERDINLITTKIIESLELEISDKLLDIGCGNGAITNLLKTNVSSIKGFDPSPYMIEIANKYFSSSCVSFVLASALETIETIKLKECYNKVLFYGSFSYIEFEEAKMILKKLYNLLEENSKVFIGNIPNLDFHKEFFSKYTNPIIPPKKNHKSSIGVWYSPSELKRICSHLGWNTSTTIMPKEFYSSYYRFDLTLSK
ncbi:class I SAM-dependent methyltransferase [Prochlorococcus marinus]|uniref:class I SAM-dependent methyltransferase n=1 Tax=Prochlorococcus marinus TaxID=1219 RepID=UPI0022B2B963|nr:class I SAM-dependent methyltransferase [Prochlorococcus marinus]